MRREVVSHMSWVEIDGRQYRHPYMLISAAMQSP